MASNLTPVSITFFMKAESWVVVINPLFPALRSGPTAGSGASPKKQIPSSYNSVTISHKGARREIEPLGPWEWIAPGESASFTETWALEERPLVSAIDTREL